jgi:hypothetical protein
MNDIVWAQMSREDRRKVRREMLKQAEKMISGGNAAQRKAMARQLVDAAISQENKSLEAWQK